jgi:hypothetical protein
MVRRAVQAQVDAKGDGAPCRVLCAAIETYLGFMSTSIHRPSAFELTLFAGFCFSLVKMFCDCVLVARAAMVKTGVEMSSYLAE